jgi:23S rRNA (adenine2030-N6)-methyltransferase
MNYRHSYHAGNFADVCKHSLLLVLLNKFLEKPTPFCYLETHAGSGLYDLKSIESGKTLEYQQGIAKLLNQHFKLPFLEQYVQLIKNINQNNELQLYLGSPLFAAQILREQDELILSELHPETFAQLKNLLKQDKRTHLHQRDGYEALKALLPPKLKRGLVFIDPAYEMQQKELNVAWQALMNGLQRWSQATFVLWYPIKHRQMLKSFYQQIQRSNVKKALAVELWVLPPDNELSLNGSGLLIVNPPWQFDMQATAILKVLQPLLSQSPHSGFNFIWLKEES